jgi:membrane protease YdiL (CAAX protease family)
MGAVVILVWLVFKRPIAEIGLTQPRNFQGWWWIIIAFVSIYVLDTAIPLSSKKGIEEAVNDFRNRTPFLPTRKRELPEYILMCFSAGVFEEIVYRGYLVTYCWYLFAGMDNRELLAVGLPAFAFAVAHYYQGAKAVLKIIVLAGFFGYLFIYSGSLLVVMILHFIVDAVGGLLTLKYVKEEEALSMDPDLINEKDPPGGPVI